MELTLFFYILIDASKLLFLIRDAMISVSKSLGEKKLLAKYVYNLQFGTSICKRWLGESMESSYAFWKCLENIFKDKYSLLLGKAHVSGTEDYKHHWLYVKAQI